MAVCFQFQLLGLSEKIRVAVNSAEPRVLLFT